MKKKIFWGMLLVFFLIIIFALGNPSFAATGKGLVNQFNGTTGASTDTSIVRKIVGPILNIIRTVGIGLAVIVLTYLGIQYMYASPDKKADIKNKMIIFTLGVVVIVGASGILSLVQSFVSQALK